MCSAAASGSSNDSFHFGHVATTVDVVGRLSDKVWITSTLGALPPPVAKVIIVSFYCGCERHKLSLSVSTSRSTLGWPECMMSHHDQSHM